MDPITTAIAAAVATTLAENLAKDAYAQAKAGLAGLKSLIHDWTGPKHAEAVTAAIAAVEQAPHSIPAQTQLAQALSTAGLASNPDLLKAAADLLAALAGQKSVSIQQTGSNNKVATDNATIGDIGGSVFGNVNIG